MNVMTGRPKTQAQWKLEASKLLGFPLVTKDSFPNWEVFVEQFQVQPDNAVFLLLSDSLALRWTKHRAQSAFNLQQPPEVLHTLISAFVDSDRVELLKDFRQILDLYSNFDYLADSEQLLYAALGSDGAWNLILKLLPAVLPRATWELRYKLLAAAAKSSNFRHFILMERLVGPRDEIHSKRLVEDLLRSGSVYLLAYYYRLYPTIVTNVLQDVSTLWLKTSKSMAQFVVENSSYTELEQLAFGAYLNSSSNYMLKALLGDKRVDEDFVQDFIIPGFFSSRRRTALIGSQELVKFVRLVNVPPSVFEHYAHLIEPD